MTCSFIHVSVVLLVTAGDNNLQEGVRESDWCEMNDLVGVGVIQGYCVRPPLIIKVFVCFSN